MKNIIITGGNRGIGLGLVKQLSIDNNVIMTVRNDQKGGEALDQNKENIKNTSYVVMDVNDSKSVENSSFKLKTELKTLIS